MLEEHGIVKCDYLISRKHPGLDLYKNARHLTIAQSDLDYGRSLPGVSSQRPSRPLTPDP
jgi:hypothetical protein